MAETNWGRGRDCEKGGSELLFFFILLVIIFCSCGEGFGGFGKC